MKKRVTVYIDGFNFYYALKRIKKAHPQWRKYYWIDFVKLFEQFIGEDQILEKVIYFTASPLNPQKSSRQGALFNANKILNSNKFELVRGKYINKTYPCPNCKFAINKPEEKRTDVNLSVRMLGDCFLDKTDIILLVTADSDLVPPVEFLQKTFPSKKIKVYFPPSAYCSDHFNNMKRKNNKVVFLDRNETKFINSIMPDIVSDGSKTVNIPPKWK